MIVLIKKAITLLNIFIRYYLGYYYYKIFKAGRIFTFQGNTYTYFIHRYNFAWGNERSVEIPIIWKMVNEFQGKKILEVGNVLSHYFSVNHDVLDKYEKAANVINQDVCHFQSPKKYDLIISISTLEHVGWDETPCEPMKILQAIENLKTLLASKGEIIITLPFGYNTAIDRLLNEGKINFTRMYCLKRVFRDNKWVNCNWQDVKKAKYNYSFNHANGLIIGLLYYS